MKLVSFYFLMFLLSFILVDYISIISLFFNTEIEFSHIKALIIPIICIFYFLIIISRLIKKKFFKLILGLLLILSIGSILPDIIHIAVFNKPINYISLMTLSDTNTSETHDFIKTYGSLKTFSKLIFIIIFPFIILFLLPKNPISFNIKEQIRSVKFILLSVFMLIAFILTFPREYVLRELRGVFIFKTYNQVLKDKEQFMKSILEVNYEDFGEIVVNSKSDNNTYILVIGESADRNRYSLYNYERDTSPYLSKIKDELFIFDDVISPHAHTSSSLELVLTFADLRDKEPKYKYGSMVDFFNSAGFHTAWISNQYKYGDYDSGYSAIANTAKDKIYINTNSWQSNKTNYYDEKLVEELENVLKNTHINKLIIVHLFGSHSPYNQRYPKEFNIYNNNKFLVDINPEAKFAKEMAYNAYDNSIIYTDFVLNKIIMLLKKYDINGYMLYLSDHGEDAGSSDKNLFYGHNESIATKPMFEIPFILWLSDKYKLENIEKIDTIKASIHNPYQTDRLIHTIIDLSNIDNKLFKEEDSLINKNFQELVRIYGNKKYEK